MKYIVSISIIITVGIVLLYISFPMKKNLQGEIKNYIQTAKNNNKATDISVFIKNLHSGEITESNGNTQFVPASMFKILVLIDFLSTAQNNPSILKKELKFTPSIAKIEQGIIEYPPIPDPLILNHIYTVEDLLSRMIKYSDNNAVVLLYTVKYLDTEKETFLYNKFGITDTELSKRENLTFISPEGYSKILESLYSAKYLNREMSDMALSILSKTFYISGIVSGIPSNVQVAHKFGIYNLTNQKEVGLNDCGIVFKENSPYSICIMTIGEKTADLEQVMRDISMITYKYIN